MTVTATGTGLLYQWFHATTPTPTAVSGATTNTLTIATTSIVANGGYYCSISGACAPSVTSAVVQVVSNQAPIFSLQPIALTTKCIGNTLILSLSAFGTSITYQWYKGTTLIAGATNNILSIASVTLADAGIYNCVISSPTCPSLTSSDSVVTVNPPPTIAPIAPISACDSYTLPPYTNSMFVTTGAPVTHYYTMPGGPTVVGNIELLPGTHITASNTIYPFCQLGNSCFDDTPMQITLYQTPVIAPITPVTVCDAYTLPPYSSILSTVPVTHYSTTATGPFTDPFPIIYAPGATVYAYAETGTTPNCWAVSPFVITVHNTPTIAPIAPVTVCDAYTLPPYSSIATSNGVVSHYYTEPFGPIEKYPEDVISSTTTLYALAESGTVPNCWTDAPWQININQAPNIITPLLLPIYNVMLGQSLSLSVVATGTNLTYQWYHGGTPITLGNNPSALTATLTIAPATLMDNGNYTCQVNGVCAPVATTQTQVIVNPLSVVENSKVDFSIYPNPASNMVTVQYSNASNTTATIAVYDLQGKQVLQQEATIENNQSRVSIASLQSGLYLIKITTADASVTKKLMVN